MPTVKLIHGNTLAASGSMIKILWQNYLDHLGRKPEEVVLASFFCIFQVWRLLSGFTNRIR